MNKPFKFVSYLFALILCSQVALSSTDCYAADKLRALFGDGSVRYASAGPISLNSNQAVLIGLLLPAVQKAQANIKILDINGKLLVEKTVTIPENFTNPMFGLSYTLSVDTKNEITLSDGSTSENIGNLTTSNNI